MVSEHLDLKWQIILEKDAASLKTEHKVAAATCLETKNMGEGKKP